MGNKISILSNIFHHFVKENPLFKKVRYQPHPFNLTYAQGGGGCEGMGGKRDVTKKMLEGVVF